MTRRGQSGQEALGQERRELGGGSGCAAGALTDPGKHGEHSEACVERVSPACLGAAGGGERILCADLSVGFVLAALLSGPQSSAL